MGQFPQDGNWLWVMSFLLKKFWNLLWPTVKSNLCFLSCLWEIFLASLLGKKSRSLWRHYTKLHYTEVYPCTLHYSSVVYKSILQCSVVLCSGVRVTWIFFLVMKLKRSLKNSWKNRGCLSRLVTASFQTFFWKDISQGQFPSWGNPPIYTSVKCLL